jgi:hypothetical protein
MQQRVALLHQMMPSPTSRWIKAGEAMAAQGRIHIDSAAIITSPPLGMEHGHVPIALYEGLEKPQGCDVVHNHHHHHRTQEDDGDDGGGEDVRKAAPTATADSGFETGIDSTRIETGTTTPSQQGNLNPNPVCPPVPMSRTCGGRCLQAGHCCVGTVSNDGRPSCAQGEWAPSVASAHSVLDAYNV